MISRKLSIFTHRPRPRPSQGSINNNIISVLEMRHLASQSQIRIPINVPFHRSRSVLVGELVVGCAPVVRQLDCVVFCVPLAALGAPVVRAPEGAVSVDHLHYVDLAASWPAGVSLGHQPVRGPNAFGLDAPGPAWQHRGYADPGRPLEEFLV